VVAACRYVGQLGKLRAGCRPTLLFLPASCAHGAITLDSPYGVALAGPDTDTPAGENRQNGGAGVHRSARGLQAHGAMRAKKVGQWILQR
jgi:hypothetical protein